MPKSLREKPRLRRFCDDCNKYYMPDGKFQKICSNCMEKHRKEAGKRRSETIQKEKKTQMKSVISRERYEQMLKTTERRAK